MRQERSSAPHVDLAGQVLTFGREPVYVRAAELPPQLADDPNLRIEAVEAAPSGVAVIELKPERVQEPCTRPALVGSWPSRDRWAPPPGSRLPGGRLRTVCGST